MKVNWLYFVVNSSLCLVQCLFSFFLLKPKGNKVWSFLLFFIPYTFLALSQPIFPSINPSFFAIAAHAVFITTSLTLFADSFKYKILVLSLSLFFNVVIPSVGLLVLSSIFHVDVQDEAIDPFLELGIILIFLLDFLVALWFRKKRKDVVLGGSSIVVFVLLTLTQMISLFILSTIINANLVYEGNKLFSLVGRSKEELKYYVILLIFVFGAADVLIFFLLRRVEKAKHMEEQLAFAEYKNAISLDYYKSVEADQAEIRKIRHDMANVLQVCKLLFDNETTVERAKTVLSEVQAQLEEVKTVNYCSNALVNAVVSAKVNICRKKNIPMEVKASIPTKVGIEDSDLCRVLVNLFDNAIEAAEQTTEPFVRFSMGLDNDSLFVITENTAPLMSQKKEDTKNHGLGMKILRSVADKYQGSVNILSENDCVKVIAILYPKQST